MLTEKEFFELDKLSPEFRDKIIAMFESPYYKAFCALHSQLVAFSSELETDPFTIRGNEDFDKFKDSENLDKIITALTTSARAKAETALKVSRELKSLADDVESLRVKLTPEEQEKANKIVTMSDVRKKALNGQA
jgi:hypothetical protein